MDSPRLGYRTGSAGEVALRVVRDLSVPPFLLDALDRLYTRLPRSPLPHSICRSLALTRPSSTVHAVRRKHEVAQPHARSDVQHRPRVQSRRLCILSEVRAPSYSPASRGRLTSGSERTTSAGKGGTDHRFRRSFSRAHTLPAAFEFEPGQGRQRASLCASNRGGTD